MSTGYPEFHLGGCRSTVGSGSITGPIPKTEDLNAEDSPAPWRRDPCPVLPHRRLRLAEDTQRGDGGADRPLRPEEEPRRRQDRPRARRLLGQQGRPALADRQIPPQETEIAVRELVDFLAK